MSSSSGIVLLDKPLELSSRQAVTRVQKLYGLKKAGHCGTLDPLATGMLPICLGRATKLVEYLMSGDKTYRATLKLGERTSTGDREGEVVERVAVPSLAEDHVVATLSQFEGEQQQVPPMYSALKVAGKPLYEKARAGEVVERQPRRIYLQSIRLVHLRADEITFEVTCSKGTYIRVLGEDIAQALGTVGYLTALRRLNCAGFEAHQMVTLDQLEDAQQRAQFFMGLLTPFASWPQVDLSEAQVYRLQQGFKLDIEGCHGQVVLKYKGRLIAIADYEHGQMQTRKLVELLG